MLNMIQVTSSMIRSIGYMDESSELYVEFTNKDVYKYFDVAKSVFESLLSAESVGKFFDANIKKKGYKYSQVT